MLESTSRKSQRTWALGPMCGPALLLDLQLAAVQVEEVVSRLGQEISKRKPDSLNSAHVMLINDGHKRI